MGRWKILQQIMGSEERMKENIAKKFKITCLGCNNNESVTIKTYNNSATFICPNCKTKENYKRQTKTDYKQREVNKVE